MKNEHDKRSGYTLSHFTTYQTALKNVSEQTLTNAIEALAKELNATAIYSMKDYYETSQRILVGLKMAGLPNGIGCRIKKGQLEIVGDPYMQDRQFEKVKALIPQYIKIHLIKQKARLLPRVRTKTHIRDKEIELVINYG